MAKKATVSSKSSKSSTSSAFANIKKSINARVFQSAKAKTKELQSFINLPDGDYIAKLTDVAFKQSKTSGKDMIELKFVVKEGEKTGKTIRKFLMLDSEDSLAWALNDLARFGYDTDQIDVESLGEVLTDLQETKPLCKLALVTKEGQDRQNCYINQVIDTSDAEEEEEDDSAEEAEDEEVEDEEAEEEADEEADADAEDEEEAEEEEEEEEEAEEEQVLEKGDTVKFTYKDGKKTVKATGKIVKINAKKGTATIKTKTGEHEVEADAITEVVE